MKKLFITLIAAACIGFFVAPSSVFASRVVETNLNKVGKCPKCGKENCDGSCASVKDTCKGKDAKCCKKKDASCDKSKKSGCCKDKEKSSETKK
jgi:hypothetical protein